MLDPDEILAEIESQQQPEESQRQYLGASEIGDPCARKLWLKFHNYIEPEQFDNRKRRLFFRGHREEPVLETLLESIGFEIIKSCLDQVGFKRGFFAGHGDGVYIYQGKRVAIEYKTHSLKQFDSLVRGKLRETHSKHYAQAIIYQKEFECDYALYVAVCKNDDRIHLDVIEFNEDHYKEYCDKAEFVTMSDKPPERIASKATDFRCKFCHAHAVCWGMELPRVDCRNCTSVAKNQAKGEFYCEKKENKELDKSGFCGHHSFNPYAMQDLQKWEPIEFLPSERAVKYQKPDGTEFTNGFDFIQSKDLKL